jgi:hypothetical protein
MYWQTILSALALAVVLGVYVLVDRLSKRHSVLMSSAPGCAPRPQAEGYAEPTSADTMASALLASVGVPRAAWPNVYEVATRLHGSGSVCLKASDDLFGAPSLNLSECGKRRIWIDKAESEPARRRLVARELAAIRLAGVKVDGDRRSAADLLGAAILVPRAALLAAIRERGYDVAKIARSAGVDEGVIAERIATLEEGVVLDDAHAFATAMCPANDEGAPPSRRFG